MKFANERRAELGRDMEALNGQMVRKKAKLDELEELMRRRVRELQELESLGLTRADVRKKTSPPAIMLSDPLAGPIILYMSDRM